MRTEEPPSSYHLLLLSLHFLSFSYRPEVVQSSLSFYEALLLRIPELENGKAKEWSALEVGCGTGLFSVQLVKHLNCMVGVDTSQGMIDVLESKAEKLREQNVNGLKGVKVLLDVRDLADRHFRF